MCTHVRVSICPLMFFILSLSSGLIILLRILKTACMKNNRIYKADELLQLKSGCLETRFWIRLTSTLFFPIFS